MADGRDEKVWTKHAEQHKEYTEPYSESSTDGRLKDWLHEVCPKGSKVIDFGCGSGLWRNLFTGYDYTGLDQNANMIKVAKDRDANMADKFQQITWNKLPLEDESIDLVFTAAVLQHNLHEQKSEVVKEFHRILKPGGIYLATENTFRPDNFRVTFKSGEYREDLTDGYSFTPQGWEKYMNELGFELDRFHEPSEYVWRKV